MDTITQINPDLNQNFTVLIFDIQGQKLAEVYVDKPYREARQILKYFKDKAPAPLPISEDSIEFYTIFESTDIPVVIQGKSWKDEHTSYLLYLNKELNIDLCIKSYIKISEVMFDKNNKKSRNYVVKTSGDFEYIIDGADLSHRRQLDEIVEQCEALRYKKVVLMVYDTPLYNYLERKFRLPKPEWVNYQHIVFEIYHNPDASTRLSYLLLVEG